MTSILNNTILHYITLPDIIHSEGTALVYGPNSLQKLLLSHTFVFAIH